MFPQSSISLLPEAIKDTPTAGFDFIASSSVFASCSWWLESGHYGACASHRTEAVIWDTPHGRRFVLEAGVTGSSRTEDENGWSGDVIGNVILCNLGWSSVYEGTIKLTNNHTDHNGWVM